MEVGPALVLSFVAVGETSGDGAMSWLAFFFFLPFILLYVALLCMVTKRYFAPDDDSRDQER